MLQIACAAALLLVAGADGCAYADGFKAVDGPCHLRFPEDHGAHPDFRTEWWYYTGNLKSAEGRRFGCQLTFFRYAAAPPGTEKHWPQPASAWRTRHLFMAHAAVSDIDGRRFLHADQTLRAALGMAGTVVEGPAVSVFVRGWRAEIRPEGHRIQVDADDFGFTLDLMPRKAPVCHGDAGYSRKGRDKARASCYYSFTRLAAAGRLRTGSRTFAVEGSAWMDQEFSTAPLEPDISGWDWFSLQLSDDTELMIYLLRAADGPLHPASSGTWVGPDSETRHLQRSDIEAVVRKHWKSPWSGAVYPAQWRLSVPVMGLQLDIQSRLDDQEMHSPNSTNVVYWEGSVEASGRSRGQPVEGLGYVEMTGYAEPFDVLR